MQAVYINQKWHLSFYDVMFLYKPVRLSSCDGAKCLEGDEIDWNWPRHQFQLWSWCLNTIFKYMKAEKKFKST